MTMSTSNLLQLITTVRRYLDKVAALATEKVARVSQADTADTLGGSTPSQIINEPVAAITQHAARRDNPHQVRAGQVGSYTTQEVADLLSRRVSSGLIPVSRYGTLDYEDPGIEGVPSSWILYFTQEQPLILNGYYAPMPITSLDLTGVRSDPSHHTYYLYVDMTAGVASYILHPSDVPETPLRMQIGTVTTGATGITQVAVSKQTKFGGYRLSATPRGQSIPHTTGYPSRSANLDVGWL